MRKFAFAAALLAGTLATPAFAQEPANAGGFHVDAIVGYDRANDGFSDQNGNGVLYGVGAGYDLRLGNAILGIEGEAADSSSDECGTTGAIVGDEICVSAGRDLYAGLRIGAVVGNNTLLYAKAGYTNARVNVDYDDGTAATGPDFSGHQNLDGMRVGAGAQFGLGPNTYVRTEYRYSNYQDGFDRHQVVGGLGFRF
ncbi:MAG TPA: porin family protein [Allosphingosinicella sp.]|nr:porin family protein [Allosphingosinicella sp.]